MDVEKLLRLVVNFVALVVLAVAAAVALVVAARGDPGVGSTSPTVRPSLVSERALALDRGSQDRGRATKAADPTPAAKPRARPARQRKAPLPVLSSTGLAIQADDGGTEAEHEEEEHADEGGEHEEEHEEESHGDEERDDDEADD